MISDGAKFNTNFLFGSLIPTLRKVALSLSLDSLIAASGSHIISIFGSDLLQSASTKTSYHSNHTFAKVFVLLTIPVYYTINLTVKNIFYKIKIKSI